MLQTLRRYAVVPTLLITVCYGEAVSGQDAGASLDAKLTLCASCHGPGGAAPIQAGYPILAGQHQYYIYVQLKDYKAGRRTHELMSATAATLEKEEMLELGKYFSEQPWPTTVQQASDADADTALRVINAGQCVACHLGGFEGNSRVPRLAGQDSDYLQQTMYDFKNKVRTNSPSKTSLLQSFSEEDLAATARYLGNL